MVTFRLKEQDDNQLTYWYFPQGKEANGHGIIIIDRVAGKVDVTQLAPDDRLRRHTLEEQLKLRKATENTRKIEQLPELTEEEWPIPTADKISTIFADHAIRKIVEAYNQGQILEEGIEVWQM